MIDQLKALSHLFFELMLLCLESFQNFELRRPDRSSQNSDRGAATGGGADTEARGAF